jgi:hypothetical protein
MPAEVCQKGLGSGRVFLIQKIIIATVFHHTLGHSPNGWAFSLHWAFAMQIQFILFLIVACVLIGVPIESAHAQSFNIDVFGQTIGVNVGGVPIRAPVTIDPQSPLGILAQASSPGGIPLSEVAKGWSTLVDGLNDVLTFGEHGRSRDRERAEAAEALSQKTLQDAQASKSQKIDDLNQAISGKKKTLEELWHLQEVVGAIVPLQDLLIQLAEDALKSRQQQSADLAAAQDAATDANNALRTFAEIHQQYSAAGESPEDNWDDTIAQVQVQIGQDSATATLKYLKNALDSANSSSIDQFVLALSEMKSKLIRLNSELLEEVASCKSDIETLKAQLREFSPKAEPQSWINQNWMAVKEPKLLPWQGGEAVKARIISRPSLTPDIITHLIRF